MSASETWHTGQGSHSLWPVWTPSEGAAEPARPRAILREAPILRTIDVAPIDRERYVELTSLRNKKDAGDLYDRLFPPVAAGAKEGPDTDVSEGNDSLEQLLGHEMLEGDVECHGDVRVDTASTDALCAEQSGTRRPRVSPRPRAVVADTSDAPKRIKAATMPLEGEAVQQRKLVTCDVLDKGPRRVTRPRTSASSTAATAARTATAGTGADTTGAAPRTAPFTFTSVMTEEMKHNDALYLALSELKYESWSHLVETLIRRAGGHEALANRNEKRDRVTKLEIKGGNITLEDVFNRNGLLHDEKFARAYRAASKGLKEHLQVVDDAIALERHSKLTNEWSSLTPEDHSWYLTHQHMKLSGQDAKKLAALSARVKKEQQAYRVEIHRAYEEDHNRFKYDHLTDRQAGQLQNDDERRQARVFALFPSTEALSLAGSIPIADGDRMDASEARPPDDATPKTMTAGTPTAAANDSESAFEFVRVLRVLGTPEVLSELAPGHDLLGHKHYLPPIGPPSTEMFTKPTTAEIDQDPIVAELLDELALSARDDPNPQDTTGKISNITLVTTASAFHKIIARDALSRGMQEARHTLDVPITRKGNTWYLHKPCMPRKLMVREKQRRLQKYAVLSEACRLPRNEPTHTIYALWRHPATGTPILVRHRSVFQMGDSPVLFGVKPEYLPAPDREQRTPEETATWNARLSLGAPLGTRTMQVAHVNVATGRILSWDTYQGARDIQSEQKGIYRLHCPSITGLVSWIEHTSSPCCHEAPTRFASVLASAHWELYTASQEPRTENSQTLDIRSIHENSTATDVVTKPFVPPLWRRFHDDLAQIPDTFPPRRRNLENPHTIVSKTFAPNLHPSQRSTRARGGRKRKKAAQGPAKVVPIPNDLDDVQGIPAPTCELDYDDDL